MSQIPACHYLGQQSYSLAVATYFWETVLVGHNNRLHVLMVLWVVFLFCQCVHQHLIILDGHISGFPFRDHHTIWLSQSLASQITVIDAYSYDESHDFGNNNVSIFQSCYALSIILWSFSRDRHISGFGFGLDFGFCDTFYQALIYRHMHICLIVSQLKYYTSIIALLWLKFCTDFFYRWDIAWSS